jgi:rod shape-determining protein MreC
VGKKTNYLGIAVLVFAVLLITMTAIRLTAPGSEFPNPVGNALNRILSPVEKTITNIGDGIKKNLRAVFAFHRVAAENEELRRQIDQLKMDNLQLKEQVLAALRYNELNKNVFNSPVLKNYNKIGATIVNRDPFHWYRTITINKGTKHGVKVNDPVVANLGLVGKVVSVTATTADILLIPDGEGKVGAFVRDSQGKAIFGIVNGTYNRESRLTSSGHLEMFFKREDEVNIGDLVFTSGLGGVYPKGIPIGVIKDLRIDSTGLQKAALIEAVVDFDSLEEVYVIEMTEAEG